MGFTVTLYTFSKKVNSTKRPASGTGTNYECVIKQPSGIFNPNISLNLGLTNSPRSFNYAFIPTFDRHYFINEWTFENGLWVANLEVDALASWKNAIGSSTCYILRSSNDYDLKIMDGTYPATNKTTTINHELTNPWITDSLDNGTFIVGIAGQSTTYYLFKKAGLDAFFDYIFSELYAFALLGAWETIYPQLKAQTNPMQFITTIKWMPVSITKTPVETVRVGWVDVPVAGCSRVDGSGIVAGEHTITLQKHPQNIRGDYLNNAPYSNYKLFYPPWGNIELDADIMANSSKILVTWLVDLRTGKGTLVASGGLKLTHKMCWVHTQVALNYQVSQVLNQGFGIGNILPGVASAGINLAMGNIPGAVAGTISNGVSAIGDFAKSKVPSVSTIGSDGGLNSVRGTPTLSYEFKEIVSEDISHRGRPLCKNRQISSLTGYMMVQDADIDLPATKQEQDKIRSYMEGGFFYE